MPRKHFVPTAFWHKVWDPIANVEHLMLQKAALIVPAAAAATANAVVEELVHDEATITAMMNMEFP